MSKIFIRNLDHHHFFLILFVILTYYFNSWLEQKKFTIPELSSISKPFSSYIIRELNYWLQTLARFQPENLEHNQKIFDRVSKVAARKGCTTAQLALAGSTTKEMMRVPSPVPQRSSILTRILELCLWNSRLKKCPSLNLWLRRMV